MFTWHKEIYCLDLPAQRVLRLQRSLTEVQVALPGIEPQEACAYVCAYAEGKGVRVAVVLHCLSDALLAFYLNVEGEVGQHDCGRVFNQGIDFAETMGFLMADTDIHTLQNGDRVELWESLPLKNGMMPDAVETEELEVPDEVEEEIAEDVEEEVEEVDEEVDEADEEVLAPEDVYPVVADFTSMKPAEVKLDVDSVAAEKAAAERAAAEKAAAEKAAAEKAAAEKAAAEKAAAEKAAAEKAAAEKAAAEKAAAEKAAAEKAAAEQAAAEQAAAEQAAAEQAAAVKHVEVRERSALEEIGRLLASL